MEPVITSQGHIELFANFGDYRFRCIGAKIVYVLIDMFS